MRLDDILKETETEILVKRNINNVSITGITDSSKQINNGSLFVAVKGYSFDGHDYISEVIRQGAVAIIGELDVVGLTVPYIQVKNSRKALGLVAKRFYGDPSNKKIMIGITGTNGKTTTSFIVKHIFEMNGFSCSIIGTICNIINGKKLDSLNTTPGTIELNTLLNESRDDVVIMEVSSHGLAQFRLEGIEFDYCVFTNLFHEHLDYHGTIEDYFEAKTLLFEKLKPNGLAIINIDDDWGEKLAKIVHQKKINTYLIGKSSQSNLVIADYQAGKNPFFLLKEKGQLVRMHLPLPGLHNVYNAAFAYSIARIFSIKREEVIESLNQFPGVPGRFEIYKEANGPTVVIDYAHTADAFFHILKTAKECGAKRILHVFGFRGGRDKTKREEMVKVSREFSDQIILTLDDLNNEKYTDMINELNKLYIDFAVEKGKVIPDRTIAILTAIQKAVKDDWIIITGKGPEHYKQPFYLSTKSDKETIQYIQKNRKRMSIIKVPLFDFY